MAHSLIMNYGLYKKLEIYRAKPASKYEMTQFHTDEYVDFLQRVTPDNMDSFAKEQGKYNVGDDCLSSVASVLVGRWRERRG